ncbi:MAG: hypothetical protein AMXMBFR66_35450 [Pseudomonadota bacterium]
MKRRAWLAAGLACAAVAGGIGWRIWDRLGGAGSHDAADLWRMRFPRPEGGEIEMAALRGRPLLLNFWATWCPPCIREMPELDTFARRHAASGWLVLGLAVDNPLAVREFLAKSPVSYPVGVVGLEGAELSRRLGNERGGLPFSVVFARDSRPVARKLGETKPELLRDWAARY